MFPGGRAQEPLRPRGRQGAGGAGHDGAQVPRRGRLQPVQPADGAGGGGQADDGARLPGGGGSEQVSGFRK